MQAKSILQAHCEHYAQNIHSAKMMRHLLPAATTCKVRPLAGLDAPSLPSADLQNPHRAHTANECAASTGNPEAKEPATHKQRNAVKYGHSRRQAEAACSRVHNEYNTCPLL